MRHSVLVVTILLASGVLHPALASEPVARDAYLMGTRVRLTTYAADRPTGLTALETALEILEETDRELSTWRDDSAISTLNRHPIGEPWQAGHQLCEMFAELYGWHEATGGAFDPAIGRLTAAWGIHDGGRIPTDAELAIVRSRAGMGLFTFDRHRCTLTRRADATIDVGAFGKGAALDRVEAVMGELPWMIDLGGQISVHGIPPGEAAWTAAIAHPWYRDRPSLEVRLREGSLSTSGGSERDLQVNGVRVAHHLDPRTGRPANFRGSVTVWHRSGLAADALSTGLYVMGPEEGLTWAEDRGLSVCFLIPEPDGSFRIATTSAFRRLMDR